MKEAQVAKGGAVTIVDSPVPTPAAGQVLIKVEVSGSNPKDWKVPEWTDKTHNSGDDIAGTVVSVGAGVVDFKAGDRVAAFHEMVKPHGSFAEYAVAWDYTTFHLGDNVSYEDAATIPLVGLTAAVSLYTDLGLPQPWTPAPEGTVTPLVVYGAGSAVGAAAIQLARLGNIHPIFAVAGQSAPFVESLLDKSKGDVVVDYRGGDEAAVKALKAAVGDHKVRHVVNAISEGGSNYIVSTVLQLDGRIATVLPWNAEDDKRIGRQVDNVRTSVGRVHADLKDLGFVYSKFFARALAAGTLKGHPYVVVPGGLAGVQGALQNLRDGKAHGVKYVFRIAETEGAGQNKL
ncbi:hypothetical protein SBRCBS47491_007905 [Sporothrix bragantina]|uniref:Enoyl reductase (ER) domain-containing protein n=1 Tax=Sporothrix bragantina TaxID=671064 RepID=A0ABP0CIE3_9PEZI